MIMKMLVLNYQYSDYKRELRLESRASAVHVTMSPRNLGCKYRCRPNPGSRKYACHLWHETERVHRTAPRLALSAWQHRCSSCGVFNSWLSVAHSPFLQKWRVLHKYVISVPQQVRMSFNGIANFVQAGVPLCSDDATHRSCTNFNCDVAYIHWDSHWFQGRKMRFYGMYPLMSRKSFIKFSIRLICQHAVYNTWLAPVTACGS